MPHMETNTRAVALVDLAGGVWVVSLYSMLFPSVPAGAVLLKLVAICASGFYHGTAETSPWKDAALSTDFLAIPLWGAAELLLFAQGDTTYLLSISVFCCIFGLLNAVLVFLERNEARNHSLGIYFATCLAWIGLRAVLMPGVGELACWLFLWTVVLFACAWCVTPLNSQHYARAPWHTEGWGYHCDFHVLLYASDTLLTVLSVL